MRFILLLAIVLLSSCENKQETILKKQQAVKEEMERVKTFYYKKLDSLESLKQTDTNWAKRLEIAEDISSTDGKRSDRLLTLQRKYDSLEVKLRKD